MKKQKSLLKISRPINRLFSILFVLGLVLFANLAQAQMNQGLCQMSKDYKFNFFSDFSENTLGMFSVNGDRLPPTVIENCKGASGKFLGFGLGLRQPYLTSDTSDVSFDGSIRPEICKIKNEPTPLVTFADKKSHFEKQFKTLRACTSFEITQLDNKPINFTADQKYCTITKLPNGKLAAKGDFCYLRITPDLRVAMSIVMNQDCANEAFLAEQGLQPGDMEALLQAYVVEAEDSMVTENMIGSSKVRVTILPTDKFLPINQDLGPESARFPTTFSADVNMGDIKLRDDSTPREARSFIDLSVFADNRSGRKCVGTLCAGSGDYEVPLAAQAELLEVNGSKKTLVDSWYAGNAIDPFVKAQWQGLFRMGRYTIEGYQLKPGHRYELSLTFFNPYDDYLMLVKHYEQILIDLTLMNGTAGKDAIQPISSLRGLMGLPELKSLPALGAGDINVELEKVRQFFNKLGANSAFPPYYDKACRDNGSCVNLNKIGHYLKLKTQFNLGPVNEDDRSYTLTQVQVVKESPLLPSYQKTVPALPGLECQ